MLLMKKLNIDFRKSVIASNCTQAIIIAYVALENHFHINCYTLRCASLTYSFTYTVISQCFMRYKGYASAASEIPKYSEVARQLVD